jgi:hypothetical protein
MLGRFMDPGIHRFMDWIHGLIRGFVDSWIRGSMDEGFMIRD